MNWVKMYFRFISMYLKQQMEYRFSFFGDIFVNMLTFVTMYMGFWVIFNHFEELNGWTYYEVVFLYNLNLFSYALSSLFLWGAMKQLEDVVRRGDFDQFLTRPIPPLRLLIFRQFGHTFIGHIIVAIAVFVICLLKLELTWSIAQIIFFIAIVIGGVLIHSAIIIAAASSAFWIVRSNAIVDVTIYAVRSFINYPISIYAKWLQIFLTFVIPYAFVNYYPSAVLLNKMDLVEFSLLSFGSPIVGITLLVIAIHVFYRGVRRYESTGS